MWTTLVIRGFGLGGGGYAIGGGCGIWGSKGKNGNVGEEGVKGFYIGGACELPKVEPKFNYCGLRGDKFSFWFFFSSGNWFPKFGSISGIFSV